MPEGGGIHAGYVMKKKLIEAVIKNGFHRTNRFEYVLRGNTIFKRTVDEGDWEVARVLKEEDVHD